MKYLYVRYIQETVEVKANNDKEAYEISSQLPDSYFDRIEVEESIVILGDE